jgi:gluconolactonase
MGNQGGNKAMRNRLTAVLAVALLSVGYANAQPQVQPQSGIPGVIAPGAQVELVSEGYNFAEGPLDTPDGGLLFTDLRGANRIHRLDANGNISVFRDKSNGANGLAYTRSGDLVAVEAVELRISVTRADGRVEELSRGDGKIKLSQPNDLFVDSKGGVYFTDPGLRPTPPGVKPFTYYLPAGSDKAMVIDDQITRPNGLTLTVDEKILIVADTIGHTVWQFDVGSDGTVRNRRPFAQIRDVPEGSDSGADGLAIDRDGRLFVTSVRGVQVFDKTGQYLDKRVLYITAVSALYRIPTLTQGPERRGK